MMKILRSQRGAIVVMTAFFITALLGFCAIAVDVANLYFIRNQLTKAADAAALAGAADLPGSPSQAIATAYDYAATNGKTGDQVEASVSDNNTAVTVEISRNVPLTFAGIFGMNESQVAASAKAANKVITGFSGAVPLGIEKQPLIYGQNYTLKEGGGSGTTGNYDGLSFGGTGGNLYCYNLMYGYSGQLSVGQWVDTEPGNMSGPTTSSISYRINQDPHATYENVTPGSPRIVVVPVIESLDVSGRKQVQIVGFASFFIEGVGGSGNSNEVTGKFLKTYNIGETSDTGVDYGLRNISLVQ